MLKTTLFLSLSGFISSFPCKGVDTQSMQTIISSTPPVLSTCEQGYLEREGSEWTDRMKDWRMAIPLLQTVSARPYCIPYTVTKRIDSYPRPP